MIKKIVKYALCVLIVLGVAISITNIFQPELHSESLKIVTYYPDIPDCSGPAKDCNDFTGQPK